MHVTQTDIDGVAIIETQWVHDERGSFLRAYCEQELAEAGIQFRTVQTNLSYNSRKGTLRGMHYQEMAKPEPKLVRCVNGAVYDVALDIRPGSPTFGKWQAVELHSDSGRALFIDAGIAHGFISLTDDANLLYHMGGFYDPDLARCVRWNDPAFAIDWPLEPAVISERDANAPDFDINSVNTGNA